MDHFARPSMSRRVLDPGAIFLHLPTNPVFAGAECQGGVAFDLPGVTFSQQGVLQFWLVPLRLPT
jgi:hypothetical protein